MVGTSAIRSPRARQRAAARRSVDSERTIRMAMGRVWLGRQSGAQISKAAPGRPRGVSSVLDCACRGWGIAPERRYGHLNGAGLQLIEALLPWPMIAPTGQQP